MGHYDSCYESDADEQYEKDLLELNLDIQDKVRDLDLDDLRIVAKILMNLENLKGFFKVLKMQSE